MIPKNKRVRLKGKAYQKLRQQIFERDQCCINCGSYRHLEHHHEPCGSSKSDELEKGVVLCNSCHYLRHNDGEQTTIIRQRAEDYLHNLYYNK